jgi:hypothetical protein
MTNPLLMAKTALLHDNEVIRAVFFQLDEQEWMIADSILTLAPARAAELGRET